MIAPTHVRVRWPAVPVDGQSLPGLIVDTARENGHNDMGTILSFARLETFYGIGTAMCLTSSREALAFVLRQSQEVVDLRANKLAEPIAGMDAVNFFGARVPAFDVLYKRRRVGDTSRDDFFHKAAWQLIHVPVDVDDGSRIVDRCQSCGAKLGWRTIDDAAACGSYKTAHLDLPLESVATSPYDCGHPGAGANDRPERVDKALLKRISLLSRLIDPRESVHGQIQSELHEDLRVHDRGIVFYLGIKLGRAIGLAGKGVRLRRAAAAPFEEAVTALEVGSEIIAGWPTRLAETLKQKAEEGHECAMAAIKAMRSVCHGESAWPEHRRILADAMPELFHGHCQHVIRRLLPDIVDGKEGALIIGIRSSSMVTLIRKKALVPVISRGTAKTHGSFLIADINRVAAAVKDSVEATSIVDETGIPLHAVEQLICEGVLVQADHVAVTALYPNLRVTRTSYDHMIRSIHGSVGVISDEEVRLPLRRAVLVVGAREKPWAAILSAMIDKSVRYMMARSAGRLVDRIDVAKSDELDMALNCTFDRRQHAGFAFASQMRQRDAIELLNIDPSRYQDIAKQFPPSVFGSNKTLLVDEILKIAGQVIDAREVQQRWGVKLDRKQMIDGGIGWGRDDIERLHSRSTPLI